MLGGSRCPPPWGRGRGPSRGRTCFQVRGDFVGEVKGLDSQLHLPEAGEAPMGVTTHCLVGRLSRFHGFCPFH